MDLPPHILVFPVPLQGHVNSMLKLAQLLSLSHLHITFFISDFNHRRLLRHPILYHRLSSYPGFRFHPISDGLPDHHPRNGETVMDLLPSMKTVTAPLFNQTMTENDCFASEHRRRVSCVIADGVLGFVGDFAEDNGIPLIYFRTVSCCSFWACYCMEELIANDEIPVNGNGMDEPVKSVPGMENFLRRRDLPGFCRVKDINDEKLQAIKRETRQTTRAHGAIFNSIEGLEGPIISEIRKEISNLYVIGPLHAHLKSRLGPAETTSSASFWTEDRSCVEWLNSQPEKSVVYVSFGSLTQVTRQQMLEFWHGLVNSEQRFLWVIRPDSIVGDDGARRITTELGSSREGAKGYMVEWAPQEEVLHHPAIGGFLTHSGWNSTLESVIAGVPMICWPYFADQTINSRFVSKAWKIGMDMKDICDRVVIEKMVRELMVMKFDEFQKKAQEMADMARKSVVQGGSSYKNFDNLVNYIKSLIS